MLLLRTGVLVWELLFFSFSTTTFEEDDVSLLLVVFIVVTGEEGKERVLGEGASFVGVETVEAEEAAEEHLDEEQEDDAVIDCKIKVLGDKFEDILRIIFKKRV